MLIDRDSILELLLKHERVTIICDLNIVGSYFDKAGVLGAPSLLLEGMIEGKQNILFIGKTYLFQIRLPQVVIINCAPHKDL